MINKAMIEIPPKFAGCAPGGPVLKGEATHRTDDWTGAQGLAEDVRRYGHWLREEAFKRSGRRSLADTPSRPIRSQADCPSLAAYPFYSPSSTELMRLVIHDATVARYRDTIIKKLSGKTISIKIKVFLFSS